MHSLIRNFIFIMMAYDQEYKLRVVFLGLFCKQPQISSDVWLFYLLSYPQYKPCFLGSWIPLAYSILTTCRFMANSHRQSKKGANREQVGMLSSTIPLCQQSCPLSHLSCFKSAQDTAALQAEAFCILTAGIRHLQSRFPTLVYPEGSSPEGCLAPEQLGRMQAHPKPNSTLPKNYYREPAGLHHPYGLPSERTNWF